MSYFMHDVMGGTVDEPDPEMMRGVRDGLAQAPMTSTPTCHSLMSLREPGSPSHRP